jgi:hypothetical protein
MTDEKKLTTESPDEPAYFDSDGNRVDLATLCRREPLWAMNRIKHLGQETKRMAAEIERLALRLKKAEEVVELADMTARAEKAEADVRFMVEKAADQKLDGYRELAARAAAAEDRRDQLVGDVHAVMRRLDELLAKNTSAVLSENAIDEVFEGLRAALAK